MPSFITLSKVLRPFFPFLLYCLESPVFTKNLSGLRVREFFLCDWNNVIFSLSSSFSNATSSALRLANPLYFHEFKAIKFPGSAVMTGQPPVLLLLRMNDELPFTHSHNNGPATADMLNGANRQCNQTSL